MRYLHEPVLYVVHRMSSQAAEFALSNGIYIFLWNSAEFDKMTSNWDVVTLWYTFVTMLS